MSPPDDDHPRARGFEYELCKSAGKLRLLFLFASAATGLMILWLVVAMAVPSLHPGTGSVVVATMNVVVAGALAIGSRYVLGRCERRSHLRRLAYREQNRDDES